MTVAQIEIGNLALTNHFATENISCGVDSFGRISSGIGKALNLHRNLPVLLKNEPLLDATFEIRFAGMSNVADLLGGYLFHVLQPSTNLIRMPAADMPQPMRASDPALQYLPTVRIDWQDYYISIGDRNVAVSCKMPYPKWAQFKAAILYISAEIAKLRLSGQVERYSLKYVNMLQFASIAEQLSKIRFELSIGDIQVKDEHISMQVHRREEAYLHIISVVTGATGQIAGGAAFHGVVVDIDSIEEMVLTDYRAFHSSLDQSVEDLRQANKEKFFACLTDEAIAEMGPSYA